MARNESRLLNRRRLLRQFRSWKPLEGLCFPKWYDENIYLDYLHNVQKYFGPPKMKAKKIAPWFGLSREKAPACSLEI